MCDDDDEEEGIYQFADAVMTGHKHRCASLIIF